MNLLFGYTMLKWFDPRKREYIQEPVNDTAKARLWLRANISLLYTYIRDNIFKYLHNTHHYNTKYEKLYTEWSLYSPIKKVDAAKFSRDIDTFMYRIDTEDRKQVWDKIKYARRSAKSLVEAEKMINNDTNAN